MNYIVLDLEFNQPYNFKTGKRTVLEPAMPFEIIQIGAIKLGENLENIGTFNYFIKPEIYSRIHPIVEKLTGITGDRLKESSGFKAAYTAFVDFIGGEECALCSWGGDDIKSLFRNLVYHNCDPSHMPQKCINIQAYATTHLNFEAGNAIGLKNAVELLGIAQDGEYHDALNDALYTAKVFQVIKPENIQCTIFNMADLAVKKEAATIVNTKALLGYFEKSLERTLSPEEMAIIKTAYKFGKKKAFEVKKRR